MPISKETESTKKVASTKKTPVKKTPVVSTHVNEKILSNTKHIEEGYVNIENNPKILHILYGAIILLMIIIAILAFYVWSLNENIKTPTNFIDMASVSRENVNINWEGVSISIIGDKRCNDCPVDAITAQLQTLPYLAKANFESKDFSEAGVEDFLIANNINMLPVFVFSTNKLNDAGQIGEFLTQISDGQYSLAIGASFDPFTKRSENGFLIMDQSVIDQVSENAYYNGSDNAIITWVEYSDVNCFYCKKMAQDETVENVLAEFPDTLNHILSPYIGVGWTSTQRAAELIECAGMLGGEDAYISIFNESLVSEKNSTSDLLIMAEAQWISTSEIQSCIDNGDSVSNVETKFALGKDTFKITGTPGNIIINNITGEYELLSWALGKESFINVINRMLGE